MYTLAFPRYSFSLTNESSIWYENLQVLWQSNGVSFFTSISLENSATISREFYWHPSEPAENPRTFIRIQCRASACDDSPLPRSAGWILRAFMLLLSPPSSKRLFATVFPHSHASLTLRLTPFSANQSTRKLPAR
jgi:hypothetical protein